MGLGKTIQIITFLGSLYDERNIVPSLIVVPNSTIANCECRAGSCQVIFFERRAHQFYYMLGGIGVREFEKWMPNLRVVPYFGEAESRRMIERYELFHEQHLPGRQALKAHVVLATDSSVRGDPGPLKKVQRWEVSGVSLETWRFDCSLAENGIRLTAQVLIVDEGQNLKSGESNLLFRRLNELKIMHRVILSGTPLNNNIGELFNLLTFIDPDGEWSDIQELKKKYEVLTTELIDELQPKLKPYFLRRIKVGVLDLPPKKELIVPISLRPLQKRIYKSILEKNVEDIHALSETQGRAGKKKTTNLNNALMQLRKCIQHP